MPQRSALSVEDLCKILIVIDAAIVLLDARLVVRLVTPAMRVICGGDAAPQLRSLADFSALTLGADLQDDISLVTQRQAAVDRRVETTAHIPYNRRVVPFGNAADGSSGTIILFSNTIAVPLLRSAAYPLENRDVSPGGLSATRLVATLTMRQRQVMGGVLAGQASKNIAADLGISRRTVETHRAAVMRKTGSASIPALARMALAAGAA